MAQLIIPNVLSRPIVVLGPRNMGVEPAGFEAINLQNPQPSDTARISSVDPIYAGWLFDAQSQPFSFDSFAMVNVNMSGHGLWRLTSPQQVAEVLLPSTITASTNITGTVGNIQNPVNFPNSQYIGPTTTVGYWTFDSTFDAPLVTAKQGEHMCCVCVRMEAFGDAILAYPKIECNIIDGATTIPIGVRAVTKEAINPGHIYLFTFNPADLSNPTLSTLKIQINGYPGDNGSYCKCESLNVYYENASTVYLLDTGYMTNPFNIFSSEIDGGEHPTKNVHYYHPIIINNLTVLDYQVIDDQTQVELYDASVYGYDSAISVAATLVEPDTYIEAGCVCGGVAVGAGRDLKGLIYGSGQPEEVILINQAATTSIAGQDYSLNAFIRRSMPQVDLYMDRHSAQRVLSHYYNYGQEVGVYVSIDDDLSAEDQLFSSFYSKWSNLKKKPVPEIERQDVDEPSNDIVVITVDIEEKL